MTINEYQKEALRTASGMSKEYPLILNGVLGLGGESGECLDIVKKHLFQGHELDREHLAEELGDVAWYLAVAARAIGYDLETILQGNVDKLRKRYPAGFDPERSLHREEKRLEEGKHALFEQQAYTAELQAEIERLENECKNQYESAEATIRAEIADGGTSCRWCSNTTRAKAIKEFAENLKDLIDEPRLIGGKNIDFVVDKINSLVIEMTEGKQE